MPSRAPLPPSRLPALGLLRCARRAIVTLAIAVLLGGLGCNSSRRTPDEDLGNLVLAPSDEAAAIDVDQAAKDTDALLAALATPHRNVGAALGAHKVVASTKVTVTEGTTEVESLTTDVTIELAADGQYHARLDNSADYGREVTFLKTATGDVLLLRPRYARWHRRPPNDELEPGRIRDELYGELAAHFELIARGVEVSDKGVVQLAGRPTRKLEIKIMPTPRPAPAQPLAQRQWRQDAAVEAAGGEILLDEETGVPVQARLRGTIAFGRDGRRFTLAFEASQDITLGAAAPTTPPAEEIVDTPERLREVDDRDFLLEGIAPPTGKRATVEPSPVPAPSSPGSGPASPGGGKAGPDGKAPSKPTGGAP